MSILELSPDELQELVVSLGQPAFRARQVYEWIYRSYARDFEGMTNLPKQLRTELAARTHLAAVEPVVEQTSADGLTTKALLRLRDGQSVEAVLMNQPAADAGGERRTVCVSSQVGCPVGCVFCATGQSGFVRHLTAGEIVGQVLFFAARLAAGGYERPVTHVVFMGQGEPLLNLAQTKRAVATLNSAQGLGLAARHITISTAGVAPAIREVAQWPWQVGLAVSLHAPNDALRGQLVPLNRKYALGSILAACRAYSTQTGRRVTYEYALIDGVNDAVEQALELAARLRGHLCHVNLIPLNPTPDAALKPSPRKRVLAFQAELVRQGIPCTVRVERGADIQGACGQLRGIAPSAERG